MDENSKKQPRWTLAAAYWGTYFEDREETWRARVVTVGQPETYGDLFAAEYPAGGFMVPAGTLGFSVAVPRLCFSALLGSKSLAISGSFSAASAPIFPSTY